AGGPVERGGFLGNQLPRDRRKRGPYEIRARIALGRLERVRQEIGEGGRSRTRRRIARRANLGGKESRGPRDRARYDERSYEKHVSAIKNWEFGIWNSSTTVVTA